MPDPLTIVADIHAKPDKIELVRTELLKLIPPTRDEAGFVQYDLHQDNDDPAHFLFFENWESRELWQTHVEAPHIAAYKAATETAIERFSLYEMTRIG